MSCLALGVLYSSGYGVEVARGTDRAEDMILLAPFQDIYGCGAEQSLKFAPTLRAHGPCC